MNLSAIVGGLIWGHSRDRVRATWRILVPIVLGVLTLNLAGGLARRLGLSRGGMMLVAFAGTTLVIAGLLLVQAGVLDRRPIREYGYRLSRAWWADLLVGVVIGTALVAVAVAIAWYVGGVAVTGPETLRGWWTLAQLGLFLLVFSGVAFYEELIYRGIFIRNALEGLRRRGLSRQLSVTVGLLASSLAFALVHLPSALAAGGPVGRTVVKTLFLGGVLGLAYLRTDELALPMGLHLGVNVSLINVFGVSGSASLAGVPTVLSVEGAASGWWSPANGLPLIVTTLVGYGLVIVWTRRPSAGVGTASKDGLARRFAER